MERSHTSRARWSILGHCGELSQILADGTVDDGSNTDKLIGPPAIVPYPFGSLATFADPIDQSVEGPKTDPRTNTQGRVWKHGPPAKSHGGEKTILPHPVPVYKGQSTVD